MCQRVLKQIRKEATTENYAPEEKRFNVLFEEARTVVGYRRGGEMNLHSTGCDDNIFVRIRVVSIDALIDRPKQTTRLGSRGGLIDEPALECGAAHIRVSVHLFDSGSNGR